MTKNGKKFTADKKNKKILDQKQQFTNPIRIRIRNTGLYWRQKYDVISLQGGLLYRLKTPSKATSIRGDQEEKVVFKIIEGSGNLGV